ncbi:zinc-dependent alcohol dehydrogenase [Natronosalvus rutilus]|uniref:Zinc-binding dehydrogenase n=1 Tax=Natronosalvus rutilus TaxID=2953753 RepID=A0A9E7NEB2_9EURY|nr:zinc-binding dehydrogenase [Natronosalvus rutilus]UTF55761.1 zinc-binding dehydrogenase [Natronosalvus rutilus]
MQTTESMVLHEPGRLEPETFDVPDVSDYGALLEVETTSVCGSDIGIYKGKSPFDSFPLLLGHEVAGRIVDGAEETLERWGLEVGDRVMPEPYIPCFDCQDCQRGHYHMCDENRSYGVTLSATEPPHLWGGYGEYMYLDPDSRLHPISDDVSGRAACLGSVIGNGVRWILRKGDVSPGDSVAIVGPGAQGLASTIVAAEAGADPVVVLGLEQDDTKLDLAADIGATETLYSDQDNIAERALEPTDGEGFDVVVVTAPASPAIQLGIDLVRPRGTAVLVGLTGSETSVELDRIVVDEISVLGGRGQALDVERAMAILERNADDVERINSHVFPVSEAETAIKRQLPGDAFDPEIVHAALSPE